MKKFFINFCKFIGISIFVLMLFGLNVAFSCRNISKDYLSEKSIKNRIENVNLMSMLQDANGQDLEVITDLKKELVEAGFPQETIDEVINSSVINDVTSDIISEGVNFLVTGEEPEIINSMTSEKIVEFARENMETVVTELQNNSVPGSEELTKEKQEEILKEIEKNSKVFEEKVNTAKEEINDKLQNDPRFSDINDIRDVLDRGLAALRFVYSDSMTYLLVVLILFCCGMLALITWSKYKYLKYIGIADLLSGTAFLCLYTLLKICKPTSPDEIKKIVEEIINSLTISFKNQFIIYYIIGFILIGLNIGIYIYNKKKNKEIETEE